MSKRFSFLAACAFLLAFFAALLSPGSALAAASVSRVYSDGGKLLSDGTFVDKIGISHVPVATNSIGTEFFQLNDYSRQGLMIAANGTRRDPVAQGGQLFSPLESGTASASSQAVASFPSTIDSPASGSAGSNTFPNAISNTDFQKSPSAGTAVSDEPIMPDTTITEPGTPLDLGILNNPSSGGVCTSGTCGGGSASLGGSAGGFSGGGSGAVDASAEIFGISKQLGGIIGQAVGGKAGATIGQAVNFATSIASSILSGDPSSALGSLGGISSLFGGGGAGGLLGGGGGGGGGSSVFGGKISGLVTCKNGGMKWFIVQGPNSGQFIWAPGTPVAQPSDGKNTIGNAAGEMVCVVSEHDHRKGKMVTLIGVSS